MTPDERDARHELAIVMTVIVERLESGDALSEVLPSLELLQGDLLALIEAGKAGQS